MTTMFGRVVAKKLETYLDSAEHKIMFLWGPRRSGKTTLLKQIAESRGLRYFNFDILQDRELFVPDRNLLSKLVDSSSVILIDEVQTYPEATAALKVLYDEFDVKVIATGSSELRRKGAKEFDTLAGRYLEEYCVPLSVDEIKQAIDPLQAVSPSHKVNLAQELMTFGAYPEIFSFQEDNDRVLGLERLVDAFVLKDIVDIYNLKDLELAKKILIMLALQVGSEVSYNEIARNLQANVSTVSNYIEVFKKNYILIELPAFKTNLRRAVSQNRKLFFFDLGIRNSLLRDFRPLDLRPDKGAVFENFIVSEVEKIRLNSDLNLNKYFYREVLGGEVDLVLEDYYKKYLVMEAKLADNKRHKKVFPIDHELLWVTMQNYQESLDQVATYFRASNSDADAE